MRVLVRIGQKRDGLEKFIVGSFSGNCGWWGQRRGCGNLL